MKEKKIVTYRFVDDFVDGVETIDEHGNEVVRFYLYKEGSSKEYMFGLTKESTAEAIKNDTLKSILYNYISEYHN
jgi:methionyl-tRNA synthetase